MTREESRRRLRLNSRRIRWLIYLGILLGVAAWRFIPRPWTPALTIETAHYVIASTATRQQTEEVARAVEVLYQSYSDRFSALPGFRHAHPKLKLLLYRDRKEMRRINPNLGWAEAFYRKPYCRAYYSAQERNPHHWMLHEAVHQLNEEVAQMDLEKWLEEGLAEYFSTSRIVSDQLALGSIDPDTYPVWWIDVIASSPELNANLENGTVIPLKAIIRNRGGPGMRRQFNLYYLHWWTLTHFVFEHPEHSQSVFALIQQGGDLAAFEKIIGPVDLVQGDWHRHVRRIKDALAGHDPEFVATGKLP